MDPTLNLANIVENGQIYNQRVWFEVILYS